MTRVAVLRGGPTSEHDISLLSGANILERLQREPYRPVDVFIDKEGVWHVRGIAMTHFLSEDVVRHPLVQKIINAYEAYEKIQAEQAEKGH